RDAEQIDGAYAELPYRLGRCYLALGDHSGARQQFGRARDLDVLRFRTDSQINETIREVAAAGATRGVRLADAEREFARSCAGEAPGEEFFLEHVHMNFHGNWLLGRVLFDAITQNAPAGLSTSSNQIMGALSEDQCAQRLAHTEWNDYKFGSEM